MIMKQTNLKISGKNKFSFSSKSINKTKSLSKNKQNKSQPKSKRTKSNLSSSLKTPLFEKIVNCKISNINKIFKYNSNNSRSNNKKNIKNLSDIYGNKKKLSNNVNINQSLCTNQVSVQVISKKTRNLKTFNIYFKTGSLDKDKEKINDQSKKGKKLMNISKGKIKENIMNNSNMINIKKNDSKLVKKEKGKNDLHKNKIIKICNFNDAFSKNMKKNRFKNINEKHLSVAHLIPFKFSQNKQF